MSIDLNNDAQEAGIIETEKEQVVHPKSEFYEVISQNTDKREKAFNYRSNAKKHTTQAYSFEEVRDLSAKGLDELVFSNEDGLTAEELIQKEYNKNSNDGREQSILMEAMRFGSQSALYERTEKYKALIEENKHELSRVANFHPLMLMGGRIVPPIIQESDDLRMIEDRYTARFVKKSYKITEQARVVNTPLHWRNYLIINIAKPTAPSSYSLPIRGNEREEQIWANGVAQGWEAGIQQANDAMIQNIRKLQSDYIGMIRFKLMLAKGMVTSPIPSNTKLGVTGDIDTLNIGESTFEIIETPKFNKDAETWIALPQIKSMIDVEKMFQ